MAKRKRTNNDLRNTKQKMKDRATRTLLIQTTFYVLLKTFYFLFYFSNNWQHLKTEYQHNT
jgi:hypothetical protein